jgi:TolA-binding protein
MNTFKRHYLHIVIYLSGLTLLAGCSTYHNATAYFNTYYNAQKLFSEAVREVEKAPQKDRDSNYFRPYVISKTIANKFEKVIEKCSKVIQLYPESSFLDRSLVMIGQSSIYRGETESAIRKFREFLENFPESSLRYESKFWLAIALYQSGKHDESLLTLQELIPEVTEAGEDNMLVLGIMLQAQIMVDREDYEEALVFYEKGMDISADDDHLARLNYYRAQCYERLNRPREAAEAYARVPKYTKDFGREFQARLKSGSMLVASGDHDAAFRTFSDLSREKLKNEERGLVEMERAKTYLKMGDTVKAFELFETIDSSYKRTDASAKAYYERGVMYDRIYYDYPRAKFYYEKAKSEFPASEVAPLAQKKLNTFIQYFKIYDNLNKYDSLLTVALTPDSLLQLADTSEIADTLSESDPDSIDDSAIEPDAIETDSKNIVQDRKEAIADSLAIVSVQKSDTLYHVDSLTTAKNNVPQVNIRAADDSIIAKVDTTKKVKDAAADSHAIASVLKSDTLAPKDSLGAAKSKIPQVNIRASGDSLIAKVDTAKKTKEVAVDSHAIDSVLKSDTLAPGNSLDSAKNKVPQFTRTPGDSLIAKVDTTKKGKEAAPKAIKQSLSPDTLRSILANNTYELASLFFIQINNNDSAIAWYQHLIDDYPASGYIPRSLYALSEIERSRGDTVAVDSLYTLILSRYDTTEYARMVKVNRGMEVDSVAQDSAQIDYRLAESLLFADDTTGALRSYSGVAEKYPKSPIAAKAMYTVGWILENYYSLNDSAYYWYKRLMKEYPASRYAAEVKGKVGVKENPDKISDFIKINEVKAVPVSTNQRKSLKPGVTRQEDEETGDQNPNSRLNRRDAQQDEEDEEVDPEEPDPDEEEEADEDPGYDEGGGL